MESPIRRHIDESLGVAFRPDSLCDCPDENSPFTASIGSRGWLMTFAGQFSNVELCDEELSQDVEFLSKLVLGTCYYGATDAQIRPFLCELPSRDNPITGIDVLTGLCARNFRSEHIPDLRVTSIAFPGYQPGTANDEIHNDFSEQYIFKHESADEWAAAHGDLKRYVDAGQLWYVLFHPIRRDGMCNFVHLFAVGRSSRANRLIGVVTCQFCHNLCD